MVNSTIKLLCEDCGAKKDCIYHDVLRHVLTVYLSSMSRQLATTEGKTDLKVTLEHINCVRKVVG